MYTRPSWDEYFLKISKLTSERSNCIKRKVGALIVKNNPDKNWNWDTFSKNPNITPSMVRNNPRLPWNWYYLSRNEMNHHPYFCSDQYCKKQLKKFWEASKEEFIAVTWHPDRVLAGWCLDEDERLAFYGI